MNGRLLGAVLADCFANVALEEALFKEVKLPTLRVWKNQKSVVIGRAQRAEFETDLSYCLAHSIPVVRRFTAGGSVYNGPGNLNWSFFIPRGAETSALKITGAKHVFESFATILVAALTRCGVDCQFEAPNSIADRRGKVCGMAAYLSKQAVLCHGTLLLNADLEEVQRLTKPSDKGLPKRYPRSRFTIVSNSGADEADFLMELTRSSGYRLVPDTLTEGEAQLASELAVSKYRTSGWNLGDPFALDDL